MIDAHRGAFEYDWRTRFRLPITAVGRSMSWGEAFRLTQQLAADPSSWVGAALSGWTFPATREALVLMDLFDLTHRIGWLQLGGKGEKPKPYPRPWPARTTKRTKPAVDITQADIVAALRAAGHTAPLPD